MGYGRRYAPPGQYLHVRTRATGRELLFRGDRDYERMEYYVGREVVRHDLRCVAYCLMPNHVHFVFLPLRDSVPDAMRNLVSSYARWFNERWARRGHLVERRYRVTPAADAAHLHRMMRYVALNPVEAKLVERAEQWPYSSYAATLGLCEPPFWLDVDAALRIFDQDPREARRSFRRYVEDRQERGPRRISSARLNARSSDWRAFSRGSHSVS